MKQENYNLAVKNFSQSLTLNKTRNFPGGVADQYTNLAIAYEKQQNYQKACVNLRKARIIYHKNYQDKQADNIAKRLDALDCI